jgi:hypothetical protein
MPGPTSLVISAEFLPTFSFSNANIDFTYGLVIPSSSSADMDFGTGGSSVTAYFPAAGGLSLSGNVPYFTLPTTYTLPSGQLTITGLVTPLSYQIYTKITSFTRLVLRDVIPPLRVTSFARLTLRDQTDAPSQTRVTSFARLTLRDQTDLPSQMRATASYRLVLRSLADAPVSIFQTLAQWPYKDTGNIGGRYYGPLALRRVFAGAKQGNVVQESGGLFRRLPVNISGPNQKSGTTHYVVLDGFSSGSTVRLTKPLASSSSGLLYWDATSPWPLDAGNSIAEPVYGHTWTNVTNVYGVDEDDSTTLLWSADMTGAYFATAAEAYDALVAQLPALEFTGYSRYKIEGVTDPNPSDNRGGLSIFVEEVF